MNTFLIYAGVTFLLLATVCAAATVLYAIWIYPDCDNAAEDDQSTPKHLKE